MDMRAFSISKAISAGIQYCLPFTFMPMRLSIVSLGTIKFSESSAKPYHLTTNYEKATKSVMRRISSGILFML